MRPLNDMKCQGVIAAFQDILQEGRHPTIPRSDKGQELRSKAFQCPSKRTNHRTLIRQEYGNQGKLCRKE